MPNALKLLERSIGVEIGVDVDEVAPTEDARTAGATDCERYSSRVRTLFRP